MSGSDIELRPIERSDLEFLRDLANDATVRANVVGWGWPLSLASQETWFDSVSDRERTHRFLVVKADGTPVGLTGLWDIDWRNGTAMSAVKIGGKSENRGQGYGAKAVQLAMEFAFNDVGLRRLHAQILEFNEASLTVYLDKCGWTREGVARQHVWRDGQFWDVIHLGILREEYEAWRAARDDKV
ncbi:MAG: GNAT family N-acetyltransferase [Cryobacterium sp.]|nr:GNAT family N-acetyltransferase [Cryobacterium sp.]